MSDEQKTSPEPTPRPDPVGERNYAMGAPVVRPEGEGTPGPMRQTLPTAPVQPVEGPEPDKSHEVPKAEPTPLAIATPVPLVSPVRQDPTAQVTVPAASDVKVGRRQKTSKKA